jgi:hypothetical protein
MSDVYQSLAHSKWDCKYHVVFVPNGGVKRSAEAYGVNWVQSSMRWPNRKNARS